jgi:uncharacterized protein (TIGR02246 family)
MVFAWTTNISHQENQPQTTRQRACDSSDVKKEVYVPAIVKKRSTKKRKDNNVLRAGRPGGANGISAICKIGEEWARRWNGGDVDGVAELYSTDAVYLPPHHEAVHGRAAIREYLRMPLAHGVSNLEFAVTYIKKLGRTAWDVGTYRMMVPQSDGTSKQDRGKYLSVWRMIRKNWLLDADAWSSDLPPSV